MRAFIGALLVAAAFEGASRAQTPRVGDVAFENSGAPAAQSAFLFGLAQLHNFEYDDAARAFREAQQIDPGFAIAYWGEAMTKNHPVWMEQDLGGARRVLERLGASAGERAAKAKTDRERAYLRAVEVLYGEGDKRTRDIRYLDEMRRLQTAHPNDVDAAAFYALALLGSAHDGRDTAIYMQAAAVLEEAFAAHPDHPGLAHYLIHSYDDPAHAPLGLRAARRYSGIAPSAPHALHMTSHIYLAAGMWDDVVAANERATAVAAARAREAGRTPPGCGHSNMWLMYGYLQQGRHDAARRVLDGCRATATGAGGLALRAPEQDPLDPDNIPAASYIQMWSRYLIDTNEWHSDLAGEDIPLGTLVGAKFTRTFVRSLRDAARTDAKAEALQQGLEQLRKARAELDTALAARREGADQFRRRADVLEQEIRGLAAFAVNSRDDGVATLERAAAAEEAMPVEFGPPFVDKPARELLAEMLLQSGRARDALVAYDAALRRMPGRASAQAGRRRAAAMLF